MTPAFATLNSLPRGERAGGLCPSATPGRWLPSPAGEVGQLPAWCSALHGPLAPLQPAPQHPCGHGAAPGTSQRNPGRGLPWLCLRPVGVGRTPTWVSGRLSAATRTPFRVHHSSAPREGPSPAAPLGRPAQAASVPSELQPGQPSAHHQGRPPTALGIVLEFSREGKRVPSCPFCPQGGSCANVPTSSQTPCKPAGKQGGPRPAPQHRGGLADTLLQLRRTGGRGAGAAKTRSACSAAAFGAKDAEAVGASVMAPTACGQLLVAAFLQGKPRHGAWKGLVT